MTMRSHWVFLIEGEELIMIKVANNMGAAIPKDTVVRNVSLGGRFSGLFRNRSVL